MTKNIIRNNKNISLDEWKKLFVVECQKFGIDPKLKSDLAQKHAWELNYTPFSLAEITHRYETRPRYRPAID